MSQLISTLSVSALCLFTFLCGFVMAAPVLVTPGKAAAYMFFPPGSGGSGAANGGTDVGTLQTCFVSTKGVQTLDLSTRPWGSYNKPLKVFYSIIGGMGGTNQGNGSFSTGGGGGSTAIIKNGVLVAVSAGGDGGNWTNQPTRPSVVNGSFEVSKTDNLEFIVGGGGGDGGLINEGVRTYACSEPSGSCSDNVVFEQGGGGGAGYTGGGGGTGFNYISYASYYTPVQPISTSPARGGNSTSGGSSQICQGGTSCNGASSGTNTSGGAPGGFGTSGSSATRTALGQGRFIALGPGSYGSTVSGFQSYGGGCAGCAAPGYVTPPPLINIPPVRDCKGGATRPPGSSPRCGATDYPIPKQGEPFLVSSQAASQPGDAGQIVLQYQAPVCGQIIPNHDQP